MVGGKDFFAADSSNQRGRLNAAISPPAIVQQVSEDDVPALNDLLRLEYSARYGIAALNKGRESEASIVIKRIVAGRPRYESASVATSVPWYVIAVIHQLECDGNFDCHLHNGDPLTARTVHIPSDRPRIGEPPFTWEQSATDALTLEGLDIWKDWTLPGTLYQLEKYNGFGSRLHGVPSPYLWGGTQLYHRGKYISDGEWNGYAQSQQIGAAILLKIMSSEGVIAFPPGVPPVCEVP